MTSRCHIESGGTNILLEGGRVIDPAGGIDGIRTVMIREGRIAEVAERVERPSDAQVLDVRGRWVTPGFVDLHVHLREPGQGHKETIASGTRAAVAGGFTTVVAMPNTAPVNDSAEVTKLILKLAAAAGLARVLPAGCISRGENGEELADYRELKEAGCVALTDDGRPVMSSALMRQALERARDLDLPVAVHEEDLGLAGKGVMNEGLVSARLKLTGSPPQAEEVMVLRDIALAELTGGRLHLQHVSTAGSVRAVREAKRRGLKVTAEVTPHHLALCDQEVERSECDAHFKMNPPLRSESDVAAVRQGLADGTLDAIATDHAPHSPAEKQIGFDRAANGVIGLETAFAVCLSLVRQGFYAERRLIEALTIGPARAFGLEAGSLAKGARADLVVLDPALQWRCQPANFYSRSGNSPWNDQMLVGRCTHTFVGGRLAHELGDPQRGELGVAGEG